MNKMKKAFSLVLGLITMVALSGCDGTTVDQNEGGNSSSNPVDLKTYRIGVIAPLSGDAGVYGVEMQRVWDYQLKEINREAEAKGQKFELVIEDGKCDGAASVAAFQKLTDVDGISVILGGFCSSETLGIIELLEDKNVVALSAGSSNPEIEGKSSNAFTLSYSDALVGRSIAEELGKYKKVALINEQNDYNEGLRRVVKETLVDSFKDTEILADEVYPKGSTDMRNVLAKINATGAEAVFLNPNAGITAITLAKQIAELGGFDMKIVTQVAFTSPDTISAVPGVLEGSVVVDAPGIQSSAFSEYQAKIVAANGTLDNLGAYYTASCLDALNMLTELSVKYDGDAMKIRDEIATGTFSGWINSTFKFDGKSFVQGVPVAKYLIVNDKLELQN